MRPSRDWLSGTRCLGGLFMVEEPSPDGRSHQPRPACVLIEVLLVFALTHLTYRAFKRFTELGRLEGEAGLNFSAGVAMTLVAVLILLVCRRDWNEYGLAVSGWRFGLGLGLVCAAVELTGAGLLYV